MLRPNSFTVSALALAFVQGSHTQNSTKGPAWVQSEYDTSPPVYPSRKYTKSIWPTSDLQAYASCFVGNPDLRNTVPEDRTTVRGDDYGNTK